MSVTVTHQKGKQAIDTSGTKSILYNVNFELRTKTIGSLQKFLTSRITVRKLAAQCRVNFLLTSQQIERMIIRKNESNYIIQTLQNIDIYSKTTNLAKSAEGMFFLLGLLSSVLPRTSISFSLAPFSIHRFRYDLFKKYFSFPSCS